MTHLKTNNEKYFHHMKVSFKIAYSGLKIFFYGTIHAIIPDLFTTQAGHASDNLHSYIAEIRKSRGIIWHNRKDKS